MLFRSRALWLDFDTSIGSSKDYRNRFYISSLYPVWAGITSNIESVAELEQPLSRADMEGRLFETLQSIGLFDFKGGIPTSTVCIFVLDHDSDHDAFLALAEVHLTHSLLISRMIRASCTIIPIRLLPWSWLPSMPWPSWERPLLLPPRNHVVSQVVG